jgi:hypothetical protein
VRPSKLLLEPSDPRLGFRRHNQAGRRKRQNGVNEASSGSSHRNLGQPLPPWIESLEQCLDHRCLDSVVNLRPARCIEPHLKVRPENMADSKENAESGLSGAGLDLREVAVIDPSGGGDDPLR